MQIHKLNDLQVRRATGNKLLSDGAGLYLQVRGGSKAWVLRFKIKGRTRYLGLGPLHTVPLALAREKAAEARRQLLKGVDPVHERKAAAEAAQIEERRSITFDAATEEYLKARRGAWRSAKHAAQWRSTLRTYASPVIGTMALSAISTAELLKILEPIWQLKGETARRVRQRVEAILDWGSTMGFREPGRNPAQLAGHLDNLLFDKAGADAKSHAALPYDQLPAFMIDLRSRDAIAARALEFAILTAARTGEVLGAKWSEINTEKKIWVVPAERMKAGREHRVPLSDGALAIIERQQAARADDSDDDEYIFPGQRKGKPLSGMVFLMLLRRMERGDITPHGFRSSFRDWAAEQTSFAREVCEQALAHRTSNKSEAAYLRTDMLDRRRQLMAEWGAYCAKGKPATAENVVHIRHGGE